MMMMISISLITSFVATLTLSASPLFLGLWVIILALFMSFTLALSSTSWLGLMMFLIYVGGLLVMFSYFVALTPNLLIEGKTMLLSFTLTLMATYSFFFFFKMSDFKFFSSLNQLPMSNLLMENMFTILVLAMILFFALVAVAKLCSSMSAPLRPFN